MGIPDGAYALTVVANGIASVTVNVSLTLNVLRLTPTLTWSTPAAIPYGTALSTTQLNAIADVPGTFSYAPGIGAVPPAGIQSLGVLFTPTDSVTYATATLTTPLTVNHAPLSVTASNATRAYGVANPVFSGSLTGVLPGDTITATFASSATITTTVGIYNAASAKAIIPTLVDPGSRLGNYAITSTNGTLAITQVTPSITWATPSAIVYGTSLSTTQLNATANVPGSFAYTPPIGTVLHAGAGQTLSLTFTPTDSADYTAITTTRLLTMTSAPLTLTAVNRSMIVGNPVPTLMASANGLVSPDTLASLILPPTITTTATSSSLAGSYPITIAGAVSADYVITFVDGTMTVTPAGGGGGGGNSSSGSGSCGLGGGAGALVSALLLAMQLGFRHGIRRRAD